MILNEIHRTESLEQILPNVHEEFPYMMFFAEVTKYPGGMIPWHWHEEIELFTVFQGNLKYSTNNGSIALSTGEGAFINTNVMHQYEPLPGPPPVIIGEVFRPSALSNGIHGVFHQKYLLPILENDNLDTLVLHLSSPVHRQILSHLHASQEAADMAEYGYEIEIRNHLSSAWLLIAKEASSLPKENKHRNNPSNDRIKKMLTYIREHFSEKISLDDIAESASISRRECLRCFQNNLGVTPFTYLLRHRCHTAAERLRNGTDSITDIAYECGFSDPSYFGKAFKEHIGMTPSEYRKEKS